MKMSEPESKCLVCQRSKYEIPLVKLQYGDENYYICPQHIPVLIHHPEELVGKLPGAEKLEPHEH
jgi:serine protease inhibitor ecotin